MPERLARFCFQLSAPRAGYRLNGRAYYANRCNICRCFHCSAPPKAAMASQTFSLPNLRSNAPLGTPPQSFTWCIGASPELEFPVSVPGMTATEAQTEEEVNPRNKKGRPAGPPFSGSVSAHWSRSHGSRRSSFEMVHQTISSRRRRSRLTPRNRLPAPAGARRGAELRR